MATVSVDALAKTISLQQWLKSANEQGIHIIYSSALVPFHYRVTIDKSRPITIEQIRAVLDNFALQLKDAGPDAFVVTRKNPRDSSSTSPTEHPAGKQIDLPVPLEEVIVTSSRYRLLVDRVSSRFDLGNDTLARRPTVAGDAMRVVNHLPGTASVGISVKPRVRGGNEDETLILFNGVRLYEPFHLSDFSNLFSTIDGRIVESLDFYTGGFPVRYGDRLSAVMSIQSKSPDAMGNVHEVGLGLYNVSYLQSGRAGPGRYLVDVRRSSLELLDKLSETDFGKPAFGDLYARYDVDAGEDTHISFNLLWYGDKIYLNNSADSESADALYNNTWLWTRIERNVGASGYSDTHIGVAAINKQREGEVDLPDLVAGELESDREFRVYLLTEDFSTLRNFGLLRAGFDYRYLTAENTSEHEVAISPALAELSNDERPLARHVTVGEVGQQAAVYASLKWEMGRALTADAGLRFDAQDYIEPNWTTQLSPRINLLYEIARHTELRLAWGRFAQSPGIHELQLGDGVDTFQPVEKSVHQIVSLSHHLKKFDIRLEVYKKRGIDTNSYFENLTNPLTLVPELQVDRIRVNPRSSVARGVELSLGGKQGNFTWWANYSRSSVSDNTDDGNIARSWDQTHNANLGASIDIRNWSLAVSGSYHTGWPTTPLFMNDEGEVEAGRRNSLRFSHYMSWDIKVRREWRAGAHRRFRLEAGITNIFNRKNQIGIEYALEDGKLVSSKKFALGIAPFFDLYWRF